MISSSNLNALFHLLTRTFAFPSDAQGNNKGAYLDRKKENPSGPATRYARKNVGRYLDD